PAGGGESCVLCVHLAPPHHAIEPSIGDAPHAVREHRILYGPSSITLHTAHFEDVHEVRSDPHAQGEFDTAVCITTHRETLVKLAITQNLASCHSDNEVWHFVAAYLHCRIAEHHVE